MWLNNNIAIFIFKTLVIIIFLLLILSVINSLSLIYSIRPSVVMTYFIFGGIVSYAALTIIDKFLLKKEDPLPEYVLKKVEINDKEIRIRSEEHTSELQSRFDLVCRLLLEKKKTNKQITR